MVFDTDLLKEAIKLLEEGKKIALCTIIEKKGHGPREPGSKMLVSENGYIVGTIGGGGFEKVLINEALKVLKEGKPRKITFSLHAETSSDKVSTGLMCGGEVTVFIDVIEPKPKIIIFGSGHIALSLAKLADIVGFDIIIVDDNAEKANKERFPMAKEIIVGDLNEILDKVNVSPRDFVVITYGAQPDRDYLTLKKMLMKKPAYVGFVGSKSRVLTLIKELKESGVSDELLKSLHAPVGLDIGAQTPEEIGVSILAEIISILRKPRSSNVSSTEK